MFCSYLSSFLLFFCFCFCLIVLSISVKKELNGIISHQNNEGQREDLELPFLDLSTIVDATDNFALNNKVGEGGFGPVYKVNLWYACTKTMTDDETIFYFIFVTDFSNLFAYENFRVYLKMDKRLPSRGFQGVLDKDWMSSKMK